MTSHRMSLLNVETQCSYDLMPEPRSEKPYQKACILSVLLKARTPGGPVDENMCIGMVKFAKYAYCVVK